MNDEAGQGVIVFDAHSPLREKMQVDLTNATEFTEANIAALLASGDDSFDSQLRVTNHGIAFISKSIGAEDKEGILFRLETWDAGENHIGPDSVKDAEWVSKVYKCLKKNWPKPTGMSIDGF